MTRQPTPHHSPRWIVALAISAIACSTGSDPASASCGPGTVQSGTQCVAAAGGTSAGSTGKGNVSVACTQCQSGAIQQGIDPNVVCISVCPPGTLGTGNAGSVGSGNTGNVDSGNAGNVGVGNVGNVGNGNTANVGAGNTANVGTGNTGNAGSGNAGNVGTGNTGNTTGGGSLNVGDGGYVTSGRWKGFAWTVAVNGTAPGAGVSYIAPGSYAAVKAGATQLCASGSVGKSAYYDGVAFLGINLNQAAVGVGTGEPVISLYTPTGTGVSYSVANSAGSDLRIQIQDTSGTAAGRWCASITGKTSGTLMWSDFNSTCWAPATGQAYQMQPIKDVAVLVPGKDVADVPFDFCINAMGEI